MSRVDVQQYVNQLRSSELKESAAAFRENVERLSMLNSLPFILVALGHAELHRVQVTLDVLKPAGVAEKYLKEVASKASVNEEIQRRLAEEPHRTGIIDEAAEVFKRIFEKPELEQAYDALIISNVAHTWTALESIVRDAWIAALNARTGSLGRRALDQISGDEEPDGLTRKQVSVGFLARFGFDLRAKLGTVLAPKFDFTSPSGILEAYRAAFGNVDQIADSFSNPILKQLEATRHVIVHSAGRVDAAYIRRLPSAPPLGTRLKLTANDFEDYLELVSTVGCSLLGFLDCRLESSPNEDPEQIVGPERGEPLSQLD